MKILHTSDVHIDSPLTSRLPQSKVRERRKELLSRFVKLVENAIYHGAKAVIIAGDLFDSQRASKKAIDTVLNTIEDSANITFFYLIGNHEGDVLRNCGRALPGNLKIFGEEWTYFNIDDVTFAGRSNISQNMFDSLSLSGDRKNIVVLHGELRDRSSSPDIIGLKDAQGKNIDYLALGHYHHYSSEAIDDRGAAVYCGTPEGRGFDETGDKGYVLISTDGTRVLHSFCSMAKRRLYIVPLELDGIVRTTEIGDRAERVLSGIQRDDIVRLELTGRYFPNLFKDTDSLVRTFERRFYYFEVKDSSRIAINPDDFKNDMSLKGEFIRTISSDGSLSDEEKEKIIACGISALMGEDSFES